MGITRHPKGRHVNPMPTNLLRIEQTLLSSTNRLNSPIRRSVITEKPWGYEELWALTDTYAAKILFVSAGKKLSLQYHENKEETMRVMRGSMTMQIQVGGHLKNVVMKEGQTIHIPPNTPHRVQAISDCWIIETSSIELDDVVRLEDEYGRV